MNYKNDKPAVRLLQSDDKDYFLDCIEEFYSAIEQHPAPYSVTREVVKGSRLKSYLVRKLTAFPFLFKLRTRLGNADTINFSAMISGDFRLMIPRSFFSKRNYIYMYDVWPRFHRWIFPLLDFFNISYVFFSSRQVFESYHKDYSGQRCKAMWLPEALNISAYQFQPLENKSIDVLEFGRNYEAYHQLIAGPLKAGQRNHIFKTPEMKILFPDKAAFTHGLSIAKIVICVPSNISHPERAENISTMTLRYLQAMASKCLIVGFLPSDMEAAFGYVPIVEIDMAHAAEQILAVLDNYEQYLPLIERNYLEVRSNHQWTNRWAVIRQKMEEVND